MRGCPASLSFGAQTPCAVPVHTSKVITLPMEWVITLLWNGRSLSNGIGDHFAVESVITLPWNPQSSPGFKQKVHFFTFDLPQSDASYVRAYRGAVRAITRFTRGGRKKPRGGADLVSLASST